MSSIGERQRKRSEHLINAKPSGMIEALEPRRMLVTFTGSSDFADRFEVEIAPTFVRVTRNGVELGTTTDVDVVVDGLGSQAGLAPDTFDIFEIGTGTRTTRLNLTIRGTANNTVTSFGTAASPIDLDTVNTNFFVDQGFSAAVDIYDQDDDTSVEPFIAYLSSSTRQVVAKGTFEISWGTSDFSNYDFFGGTSDDVFSFSGSLANSRIDFDGGEGDDLVQTINFNNNNRDNDLDAAMSEFFMFKGGPGNDFYDLDDSADQTGDGDSGYSIRLNFVAKVGRSWNFQEVEEVSVVCDADNNRVSLHSIQPTPAQASITVHGGLGNDTFSNFSTSEEEILDFEIGGLFGGPGIDTIELFDVDNPNSRFYRFEPDVFSFSGNDVEYDSSTEMFLLEENDISSTNRLLGKPAGMAMNINALGGADSFQDVGGGDLDDSGLLTNGITVSGGAGNDFIEFDDQLDASIAGEDEAYTFGIFTLAKGGSPFNYNAFEGQELRVANGPAPSGNTVPTVNLHAISGQLESTRIFGGAARLCTVNLANGDLVTLSGTTTLQLQGGTINFNDGSATTARDYNISATQMTTPAPVTFSGATLVNVNAGTQDDDLFLTGSSAPLAFNGNVGDDLISLGGGFANYASPVTLNGQAGEDIVRFNGSVETEFVTGTLRSNSFETNGLIHSYATCETVVVNTGSGGSDITIQSVPQLTFPAISTTAFIGGGGDDVVRFATGNAAGALDGNTQVTGGGGSDSLIINDSGNATARDYTFDQGNRFYIGTITQVSIVRNGVERTILEGTNGRNTVTVNVSSSPLTIRSNGGNDTINVLNNISLVTVNTGPETPSASAPFGDSISVNTDGGAAATVLVDESDSVLGLNVAQGGTLRIGPGGVLDKLVGTGSTFTLAGTVDLAGGALLNRAGGPSLATFRSMLTAGRNSGAWNGTSPSGAINSSLAASSPSSDGVGYGLGSQVAPMSIGSFSIAAGDTLVRYALDGDANLSGNVNLADFNRLATNFGQPNRAWVDGDSNYDGLVNLNDFNGLAGNFGAASAAQTDVWCGPRGDVQDIDDLREQLEELS
jgi:hypothetical protein